MTELRYDVQILVVVLPLRRELDVFASGLGILEDFSFVIANDDLLVVVIEDVAGLIGTLPPPPGASITYCGTA